MKLTIAIFIFCVFHPIEAQIPATRVADLIGGKYIAGYKISGQLPAGYEKFLVMWVDDPGICRRELQLRNRDNYLPKPDGRIAICGRVVFQGKNFPKGVSDVDGHYLCYEFKEAYLVDLKETPVRLEFVTQMVDGVNYRFNGSYLESSIEPDVAYLEGTLTKLVNGQPVSETKLRFSPDVTMIE